LVELLQGTTGRNFDVESLFVERLDSGQWRWVVYEFLKAESIPPQISNPNYYWHKNSRKFLSLWALVNTLRRAGYFADLILVNYADDRSLGVKEMIVQSIELNPTEVFREESNIAGVHKPRLMRHVVSKDTSMSFEDFKTKFVAFNDNKKGDTWEILNSPVTLSSSYEELAKKVVAAVVDSGIALPDKKDLALELREEVVFSDGPKNRRCEGGGCGRTVSDAVESYSKKHFAGKVYCMSCQKKNR
jgi:hypothetical protein